ncbi:hypothetical protein UlMin_032120 [Ulmus minor]
MSNTVELCVVALLIIWFTHWFRRWRNPKCNGVLPPGSMGFPLIGETLPLIIPSYSLDLHPFIKTRLQRYGPIFKTNIIGRPAVVSADSEFNNYIIQQEGRLVELWYLDSFSKLFVMEGESRINDLGAVHKYSRSAILSNIGAESIKERLLPQIEELINKTLRAWSTQSSVEVKNAIGNMVVNFTAKIMIGYDAEKSNTNLSEVYEGIADSLMSIPLNIPGTTYNKCLKDQKGIISMFKDMLKERLVSPNTNKEDFLGKLSKDKNSEKFLTEEFIVHSIFVLFFASLESISSLLALALKFLSENPSAMEELKVEHEAIIQSKENMNSSLTWDEYKSMTFTQQVINETLRMANVAPGLLRRTLKDVSIKGFTIPAGWTVMLVTPAKQLNPSTFPNPLEFNPWRCKELDSYVVSKNFTPFGGGMRQCAGAEFTRAFAATFLHVLVTKYRWTVTKVGKIGRNPILGFGKGIHIKFSEKEIKRPTALACVC